MSCLLAKAVMGVGLGLLVHAAPLLERFGLPSWHQLGAMAATSVPFNAGTGFFVNAGGDFVSPYHVVGDCPLPVVETPGGLLAATPVASSEALDVTILRTGVAPAGYARFPDYPSRALLDPVIVPRYRGCGGPQSWEVTRAVATSLFGRAGTGLALRAERPIVGGNSGSPVVDAGGAVLGMLVARARQRSETGYAVDAQALTQFLVDVGVPFSTVPTVTVEEPDPFGFAAARHTYPVLCLITGWGGDRDG